MKYATPIALASLAGIATAASPMKLAKRADEFCGQYDTYTDGNWIVYNDLWGEDEATSGSQCTTVSTVDGDSISWSTSWSWEGISYDVKSFANAEYTITATELSAISSIPTTWDWRYDDILIFFSFCDDISLHTPLPPPSAFIVPQANKFPAYL